MQKAEAEKNRERERRQILMVAESTVEVDKACTIKSNKQDIFVSLTKYYNGKSWQQE